ncbi:MAG: hypothetical protein Ta2A_06190 [Treponemataceae bacterium]|nr:MAG: hypothetical protein Ta2A_06190 [Treponemataceae bacterium]
MKPVHGRVAFGLFISVYLDIVLLIHLLTGIDLSGYIGVVIMVPGGALAFIFSEFMSRDYEDEKENNNIIFGVGLVFAIIIFVILASTLQYFPAK